MERGGKVTNRPGGCDASWEIGGSELGGVEVSPHVVVLGAWLPGR